LACDTSPFNRITRLRFLDFLVTLLADHTGDHLWSRLGLQNYKKNRNSAAFL
jgi:hypothetical protein